MLKWPSSPVSCSFTVLPALSVTVICAPGRFTAPCVVTTPLTTPVRGAGCAWRIARRATRMNIYLSTLRAKRRDEGTNSKAERRARQHIHGVVISADHARDGNADRAQQKCDTGERQ